MVLVLVIVLLVVVVALLLLLLRIALQVSINNFSNPAGGWVMRFRFPGPRPGHRFRSCPRSRWGSRSLGSLVRGSAVALGAVLPTASVLRAPQLRRGDRPVPGGVGLGSGWSASA